MDFLGAWRKYVFLVDHCNYLTHCLDNLRCFRCKRGRLALSLCECYRETMLSPQEDAYGQCMYKHFHGGRAAEVLERDDGYVQSNVKITAAYFAECKDWPAYQVQVPSLALLLLTADNS